MSRKPKASPHEVADWLAQGVSIHNAEARARQRWNLSRPRAKALVQAGEVLLFERFNEMDRHPMVARVLARLEHITDLGIQRGQLNVSVQALALVAKLAALEPQSTPHHRPHA